MQTVLVPYNGSAEVTQGLLTKSVDFTFDGPSAAASLIQSGQFRVLAKFDDRPFPPAPDAPMIADRACPSLDQITVWLGLVAPKGTPPAIVDKAAAGDREDAGRSRHQGQGRRRRALSRDQHAGRVRGLHQDRGGPLVEGRGRERHEIRLTELDGRALSMERFRSERRPCQKAISESGPGGTLTQVAFVMRLYAVLRRNKIPCPEPCRELCSLHQDRGFSPAPQRVNDHVPDSSGWRLSAMAPLQPKPSRAESARRSRIGRHRHHPRRHPARGLG